MRGLIIKLFYSVKELQTHVITVNELALTFFLFPNPNKNWMKTLTFTNFSFFSAKTIKSQRFSLLKQIIHSKSYFSFNASLYFSSHSMHMKRVFSSNNKKYNNK